MPYQCLCRTHAVMDKEEHEAHMINCKIKKGWLTKVATDFNLSAGLG